MCTYIWFYMYSLFYGDFKSSMIDECEKKTHALTNYSIYNTLIFGFVNITRFVVSS